MFQKLFIIYAELQIILNLYCTRTSTSIWTVSRKIHDYFLNNSLLLLNYKICWSYSTAGLRRQLLMFWVWVKTPSLHSRDKCSVQQIGQRDFLRGSFTNQGGALEIILIINILVSISGTFWKYIRMSYNRIEESI